MDKNKLIGGFLVFVGVCGIVGDMITVGQNRYPMGTSSYLEQLVSMGLGTGSILGLICLIVGIGIYFQAHEGEVKH